MKIDFSKFPPADFVPILGKTCPALGQLETGDLLFPRLSDAVEKKMNEPLVWQRQGFLFGIPKKTVLEWFRKDEPIRSVLKKEVVEDLLEKAKNPDTTSEHRALNLMALKDELQREKYKKVNNTLPHLNSSAIEFKLQRPDFDTFQQESIPVDLDEMLSDPRVIELLIKILNASGFGDLVQAWFNVEAPKTVSEFRDDPLVGLLLDLLSSDDVRNEVFIGHVGIVIKENNNLYVIEGNITSYSHYRVAIHPYYVGHDSTEVSKYLVSNYKETSSSYLPTTDFELYPNQVTGWVNRRAAMLQHVWHARPGGLDDQKKQDLISAAKALHGRPFGFFDHPKFGNNDRMYCAEYVYNAFKDGISEAMATELTQKMTWGYIRKYLELVGNAKMLTFVDDILKDIEQYKIHPESKFFVLPPAILWNSNSLSFPTNHPGVDQKPYAPDLNNA